MSAFSGSVHVGSRMADRVLGARTPRPGWFAFRMLSTRPNAFNFSRNSAALAGFSVSRTERQGPSEGPSGRAYAEPLVDCSRQF